MDDPDRLNRVHVVTVRGHGDKFFVYLNDGSSVAWEVWITLSEAERRSQ